MDIINTEMPIIKIKPNVDVKPFNIAAHLSPAELDVLMDELLTEGNLKAYNSVRNSIHKTE